MIKNKNNQHDLIEKLKDDKEAEAYFWAVLEECKNCDKEEAQKRLVVALKNLSEAQGGVANLAKKAGLECEPFYKTLSTIILKIWR